MRTNKALLTGISSHETAIKWNYSTFNSALQFTSCDYYFTQEKALISAVKPFNATQ